MPPSLRTWHPELLEYARRNEIILDEESNGSFVICVSCLNATEKLGLGSNKKPVYMVSLKPSYFGVSRWNYHKQTRSHQMNLSENISTNEIKVKIPLNTWHPQLLEEAKRGNITLDEENQGMYVVCNSCKEVKDKFPYEIKWTHKIWLHKKFEPLLWEQHRLKDPLHAATQSKIPNAENQIFKVKTNCDGILSNQFQKENPDIVSAFVRYNTYPDVVTIVDNKTGITKIQSRKCTNSRESCCPDGTESCQACVETLHRVELQLSLDSMNQYLAMEDILRSTRVTLHQVEQLRRFTLISSKNLNSEGLRLQRAVKRAVEYYLSGGKNQRLKFLEDENQLEDASKNPFGD